MINNIKDIFFTGTVNSLQPAGNYIESNFEIKMLLPDNMVQVTQIPGSFNLKMYSGIFVGEVLSATFIGTEKASSLPMDSKNQEAVNAQLDNMARLLLGTVMKAGATSLTIAENRKKHGVYDIDKTKEQLCEIEFDKKEAYPAVIRFSGMPSQASKPVITSAAGKTDIRLMAPTAKTEITIRFMNRISVDGIMFPKTIIYESHGNVERELRIEKISINSGLGSKDFKLPQ